MRTLEEEARAILGVAQNILTKSGEIMPHMLVMKYESKTVFYVGLAVDKKLWKGLILDCLKRINADRWVFVDEVWSVDPENWVQSLAVSENPAKFESIFILACDRTGETFSIRQQFLRDAKGIKLMAPTTGNDCETHLFPMRW